MTIAMAVDIIGWIGAALLLTAYAAVSSERWLGRSLKFQFFNLAGSACLIANTVFYGAYPSAAVNIVWIVIALAALRGMHLARHAAPAADEPAE